MDWLSQNWIWLIVVVLFFAMHLFGHGGHGGHGGHQDRRPERRDDDEADRRRRRSTSTGDSGHAH